MMPVVSKELIVPYTQEQMYTLVADIKLYPEFIRWCLSSKILSSDSENPQIIIASLEIGAFGIEQELVTRNTNIPFSSISMELISGPFSHFNAQWEFKDQDLKSTAIKYQMDYEFSSETPMLRMIAPFFEHASQHLADLFINRAKELYAG